ncbi:hypothetical protein FIBSPDRAFT_945157 [Athelia psychrophila]|uniref:Uncharacterized protein n=1 Tax=Athelia psychrophila TaxID=1759441 RepID=A0A166TYE0_9AGAM|nr:hypothetical protein FIBSPDRAFT_945157 [Fibularhizoctonia sp. CBS 109695]
MSTTEGQIFNVAEPTGADQARFETSAAEAERDAPNPAVAHEIEANAQATQSVAEQAANAAHSLGPTLTGGTNPVDQFQREAAQTTDAAVAEGQANVASAKAAGAGYLSQAQDLASGVIASAQSFVQHASNDPKGTGVGVGQSIQTTAATALSTAKELLSAGAAAAQPHVETARSTAQPHLDRAKETIQGYVAGTGATTTTTAGGKDVTTSQTTL